LEGTLAEQTPATPDFEAALAELESLVERMEQGNLSLEETLAQFERGIRLTRSCQSALKAAEQKVEILVRQAGGDAVEPFEPKD
jgi:exodeoxyribonuclease VII small subunit